LTGSERFKETSGKMTDPDHGTLKKSQMELLLPLLRALCFNASLANQEREKNTYSAMPNPNITMIHKSKPPNLWGLISNSEASSHPVVRTCLQTPSLACSLLDDLEIGEPSTATEVVPERR